MPVDPEYLRRHYASLSDEALLEIDRDELVPAALDLYEAELRSRDLESAQSAAGGEPPPDWLDEAAEVYSRLDSPGGAAAPDCANACKVLEDAGIPCHLEFSPLPEAQSSSRHITHQWRVLVPGNMNLHAASVLDRDIFNEEFEAEWRTHLETLTGAEVAAMDPEDTFCGLFDRIERITRAYQEELARRGLARRK